MKNGKTYYWVSRAKGSNFINYETGAVWTYVDGACDAGDGQTVKYGGVPVEPGTFAYVFPATDGVNEESMVICGVHQPKFKKWEDQLALDGMKLGAFHVAIGSRPTATQLFFNSILMGEVGATIGWLTKAFSQTFIHETTHSEAFVGKSNGLGKLFITASHMTNLTSIDDIYCTNTGFYPDPGSTVTRTHTDPKCLNQIAQGQQGKERGTGNPQGHLDAGKYNLPAMFC